MNKRKLGWTDLELSVVGLGTFPMGGSGWSYSWGPQDDRESIATILHALEKGVNWIDTAPTYGLGHSEEVVGTAIRELRTKPIISTKCGLVWDEKGQISGRLTKESIRSEVEASLRRMRLDVIDLMQIHWPDPDRYIEEAWYTISELAKEGKIRYAGVSNFSVRQLKRIQPIYPVASLQPLYNMLERYVEAELLDYCKQNDIGVIVYSPLAQGILTGKFSKERLQSLPDEDFRHRQPHFQEPELSLNLEMVEGLSSIATKSRYTVAQLAIAWILRRPEVTSAIVGARSPSQIDETAAAREWSLSRDDVLEIDKLLNERVVKLPAPDVSGLRFPE